MYGQNTNNVFSLENNKQLSGVHMSDILPNPVFPAELETCNTKLCFYNASGDLTLCDPSEFLSYSDIVKSFKSMSSHKGEAWGVEESVNISLPLSDVPVEPKPDLPRDHETDSPASLIEVLEKPSEGFLGEIEVNSTVIVLSDEVDDDDDIEDDNVDGDNISQKSNHDSDKSSVEFISDNGPALPTHIIKSEQCHDDAGVNSEDVGATIVEFPDNAEVNFGIEDIVEVTVTTENATDEAVGVSDSVNEKRENYTDDDSDFSLPSLKAVKDDVQLAGTDMEDSDGMPSLMPMNGLLPPQTKTSVVRKSFNELSYNGDDSVKTSSVICTCGDYKEKSKSPKSRIVKPQAEAKCPKHNHHSRTSQADCESSRFGVSNTCDMKSSSDHRLKSGDVLPDDDNSSCVSSGRGSTKSPKTYKENADAESFSLNLVKDSKRKHVHMVDSSAFHDAALKLKSVCSEVASKSPLSRMSSKSPSSYLYQSKSPPSSLPHLMTPSSNSPSKSPLSELSQSKSPSIFLPQSRSPSYFSALKSPPSSSHHSVPPSPNVSPSKAQPLNPHASLVSALPKTAPVTNTTTIILSSGNKHKEKSSRSHDRSKSRKHKSSLHKQSSVSSSSTRPSSRSSNSSEASLSNSRSSSDTSMKASSDAPSSKSKSSSDESLADSRSLASSSHSKPASGTVPHSRTSHGSSKSKLLSKSSSHSSSQSSGSTDKKFFKDTVPNLYSSSDEEDTVQENKTEIVKKIYSPRRKQEGTAGIGHVSRQSASFKSHKRR